VAILHAQRADQNGNTQLWGLLGVQKEVAFAARSVVVVVEEIVDEEVIRADPNRTLIPGLVVAAVVHEPYGAHPSYAQGCYDRDNSFYLAWEELSRDRQRTEEWLAEWVFGVPDRAAYLRRLGAATLARLRPTPAPAGPVDYGRYG
jgi:glutaconate CoA-transferase, subunit A